MVLEVHGKDSALAPIPRFAGQSDARAVKGTFLRVKLRVKRTTNAELRTGAAECIHLECGSITATMMLLAMIPVSG
jgi:hypothetical protein